MSVISRLQSTFDAIVHELRERHPELTLVTWSHSLGEATDLDGWSMGFTLEGLAQPIECEIYLTAVHSQSRQQQARAQWKSPTMPITIWDDWQVRMHAAPGAALSETEITELTGLREGLLEAIARGPVRDATGVGAAIHSYRVEHPTPTPEVRESLRPEEVAVYRAWFAYLRNRKVHPLRLIGGGPPTRYHPHSHSQRRALADLMDPKIPLGEALVDALFSPDQIPPELQGPGLEIVLDDQEQYGREFYARHPRAHGCMWLSPIGFGEERAALVISNRDGGIISDQGPLGETVTRLGNGGFLAAFERQGSGWRMERLSRLPWNWVRRTLVEGELLLHFASRAQLRVLDRDLQADALRLHIGLEPYSGRPLEFHLMERSYLNSDTGLALDCQGTALVVPYLWADDIIPELEKLVARF